jgi:hypothetical protein
MPKKERGFNNIRNHDVNGKSKLKGVDDEGAIIIILLH